MSVSLAAAVLAALIPAAVTAAAQPSVAAATWETCFEKIGPGYECDIVRVPLDYDHPSGPKISIAMVRLRATDPDHRIGSVFINPGGPGGSGVDFAVGAGKFLFTDQVRARFDIVGFDPRGIIRSDPLRCFESPDDWGPYFTPFAFPITERQTERWIAADRYLDHACLHDGNRILDHMSTANVARDLDLLRQAVGDQKLTYYGVSYGSMLGQTYANLFPGRFRALVIDGVLDPIAWTTGKVHQADLPFSTRLHSDAGAQATLDEFFRLCDAGGVNCPFAGDAAGRYRALAEGLLDQPIQIADDEGSLHPFRYQDLIGLSLGSMYDSASWPDFADTLAALESFASTAASAAHVRASLERLRQAIGLRPRFPEDPVYPNFVEGFPGAACSDSDNPDQYRRWTEAGADSGEVFGYFGRLWTWVSSICAEWPGQDQDRYMGPFDTPTTKPVLVVGNIFDPATRYEGARRAHDLLPNSALLTVHGWGHTSLFLSACADHAIAAYLIRGTTPSHGTVCEQDDVPFTHPSTASWGAAAAELAARRQLHGSLIPEPIARTLH